MFLLRVLEKEIEKAKELIKTQQYKAAMEICEPILEGCSGKHQSDILVLIGE